MNRPGFVVALADSPAAPPSVAGGLVLDTLLVGMGGLVLYLFMQSRRANTGKLADLGSFPRRRRRRR